MGWKTSFSTITAELTGNKPHSSHSSHLPALPHFASSRTLCPLSSQRAQVPVGAVLSCASSKGRSHLPPQPTWDLVHSQIQHILRPSGGGGCQDRNSLKVVMPKQFAPQSRLFHAGKIYTLSNYLDWEGSTSKSIAT